MPVGAEGDGQHRIFVAAQHADLPARSHLPQTRGFVKRAGAGGKRMPVGAEGDGPYVILVAAPPPLGTGKDMNLPVTVGVMCQAACA
jgi:hypothetical protein